MVSLKFLIVEKLKKNLIEILHFFPCYLFFWKLILHLYLYYGRFSYPEKASSFLKAKWEVFVL